MTGVNDYMLGIHDDTDKAFWAFDVETYPNFFSFTALSIEGDDVVKFEVSERVDQRACLSDWIQGRTLIGYNSIAYDNAMVNYVLGWPHEYMGNEAAFQLSSRLISEDKWFRALVKDFTNKEGEEAWNKIWFACRNDLEEGKRRFGRVLKENNLLSPLTIMLKLNAIRYSSVPYGTIDLAKILTGNGGRFPSLKQVAIHLRWPRLQDLPYDPTIPLTHKQMDEVLDYNLNDVRITKALYNKVLAKIQMRRDTGKMFGVNLINASESKIANVIFEAKIGKPKIRQTHRIKIMGRDIVAPNIVFHTDVMKDTLAAILDTDFAEKKTHIEVETEYDELPVETKGTFSFVVNLFGVNYKMGVGGLHSVDKPGEYTASADCILRDADVSSYYPFIIINNEYEPEHLNGIFLGPYKDIVYTRIAAKKRGDNVTAEPLKIAANGSFGKLNSKFFWLYDPKVFFSVTLNGQLYLLDLIEKLNMRGIQVISANTDGIVSEIHPSQEADYYAVCKEWQERTRFDLEFTDYKKYIRRDVNNYISLTTSGKVKEKGAFLTETNYSKGYDKPIIAKAIRAWLIDGVPPEDTIMAEKSIYEFCMTKDIGKQYTPIFKTREGEIVTQKHNRFYITKHVGGQLLKRRENGQVTAVVAKHLVWLANDVVDEENMPEPDYPYYIKEAWKLIHKIQPPRQQMTLF